MKRIMGFVVLMLLTLGSYAQMANDELLKTLNKEGKVALYINFETSKSEINPESQGIVDQLVTILNTDKSLRISIEGHTDNAGNPKTNLALSESRARAVMEAIIAKGVDKNRLSAKGWGSKKPIADNNTEDAKARNRRVEIIKLK